MAEEDKSKTQSQDKSQNQEESQQQNSETLEYEGWLESQPENVKTMLGEHTKGLKTALESERSSRKNMEKELRAMAGKAEKGSETEAKLTEMADAVQAADRRADFYEQAHAAGVTNLKLAYLAATEGELLDRRGNVDFAALKRDYPELFGNASSARKKAPGDAGNGNDKQPGGQGMNDFIRKMAGRD